MRKASLLPLVFALGLWAGPAIAQSANGPRYLDSNPAPGEFLHKAPEDVSIAFSEPLGPGSTMTVSDACGRRADDGGVVLQDNEMRVGLASSPSGDYTVSYVAQGSEDGSGAVPGSFSFEAHLGPKCDGSGGEGHHHQDNGGSNSQHGGGHDPEDSSTHTSGHPSSEAHPVGAHAEGDHLVAQQNSHPTRHGKEQKSRRRHHRHGSGSKGSQNQPGTQGDDVGAQPAVDADDSAREATGADALLALALAAFFGAVGGLILRASPER